MTRQAILDQYKVDEQGIIHTLRKFEGEMLYVPYFWEAFLDGAADRDDGDVIGFDLTKEDKAMFPKLKGRRTVRIYQRSDGFVCEA
mgnify:CR=1 FL=1